MRGHPQGKTQTRHLLPHRFLPLTPLSLCAAYGHLRREAAPRDPSTVVHTLRGGLGYATGGDKAYAEPIRASGFYGERSTDGLHAEAKPARWYRDPAGPRAKVTWAKGSAGVQAPGRPLWGV